MQKKTPSRLSTRQQRTLLAVVALGVFMVADTLYLLTNRLAEALNFDYFAVTDISLPKFYQVMVLSHTGVGWGWWYWRWACGLALTGGVRKSRKRAIYTGIATLTLGIVLAISGQFILSAASNRGNPVAYWSHVAAAVLVPLFYLAHRRLSLWKPSARSYRVVPIAVVGLLALAVVLHGLSYSGEQYTQAARRHCRWQAHRAGVQGAGGR